MIWASCVGLLNSKTWNAIRDIKLNLKIYGIHKINSIFHLHAHELTPGFLVGFVFLIFLVFLCCPIRCLYILNSMLWCPLWFSYENVLFIYTFSCLWEGSCLIYVIWVSLCIVMSNAYCVVFLLCFSVLCTICCKVLWIAHFVLSLRVL